VVNKVASIRFTSAGSRESLGSQHWVRWLYSWVKGNVTYNKRRVFSRKAGLSSV
jgi:hypothetical protein